MEVRFSCDGCGVSEPVLHKIQHTQTGRVNLNTGGQTSNYGKINNEITASSVLLCVNLFTFKAFYISLYLHI